MYQKSVSEEKTLIIQLEEARLKLNSLKNDIEELGRDLKIEELGKKAKDLEEET